jgi:hypothetical protein
MTSRIAASLMVRMAHMTICRRAPLRAATPVSFVNYRWFSKDGDDDSKAIGGKAIEDALESKESKDTIKEDNKVEEAQDLFGVKSADGQGDLQIDPSLPPSYNQDVTTSHLPGEIEEEMSKSDFKWPEEDPLGAEQLISTPIDDSASDAFKDEDASIATKVFNSADELEDFFGVHFADGPGELQVGPNLPPLYKRDNVTGRVTGEIEEETSKSDMKWLNVDPLEAEKRILKQLDEHWEKGGTDESSDNACVKRMLGCRFLEEVYKRKKWKRSWKMDLSSDRIWAATLTNCHLKSLTRFKRT